MDNENNNHETIITEIIVDKKSSTFNFPSNHEDDCSEDEVNKYADSYMTRKKNQCINIKNLSINESEISDYNDSRLMKRQAKKIKSLNKKAELIFSIRHTIFIIMLWTGFVSSLLIGMILHFPLDSGITASSILWTISFIFLVISVIFTYFYCRIRFDIISKNDEVRYLSYFPF